MNKHSDSTKMQLRRDAHGRLVLTLNPDNKVEVTRVKLGERVDTDWVVLEGLNAGQKVIVEGIQKGAMRKGVPCANGYAQESCFSMYFSGTGHWRKALRAWQKGAYGRIHPR